MGVKVFLSGERGGNGCGNVTLVGRLSNKHSPNGAIRTRLFPTLWILSVVVGNVTVKGALTGEKAVV